MRPYRFQTPPLGGLESLKAWLVTELSRIGVASREHQSPEAAMNWFLN